MRKSRHNNERKQCDNFKKNNKFLITLAQELSSNGAVTPFTDTPPRAATPPSTPTLKLRAKCIDSLTPSSHTCTTAPVASETTPFIARHLASPPTTRDATTPERTCTPSGTASSPFTLTEIAKATPPATSVNALGRARVSLAPSPSTSIVILYSRVFGSQVSLVNCRFLDGFNPPTSSVGTLTRRQCPLRIHSHAINCLHSRRTYNATPIFPQIPSRYPDFRPNTSRLALARYNNARYFARLSANTCHCMDELAPASLRPPRREHDDHVARGDGEGGLHNRVCERIVHVKDVQWCPSVEARIPLLACGCDLAPWLGEKQAGNRVGTCAANDAKDFVDSERHWKDSGSADNGYTAPVLGVAVHFCTVLFPFQFPFRCRGRDGRVSHGVLETQEL
ncbi:hypothetical protein BC830DRAFT_410919 [Chytriomyces sp. MP71]|nr:hypothetical protein BC830DRAFT_410919 [Chytriomyces sp. MP71]